MPKSKRCSTPRRKASLALIQKVIQQVIHGVHPQKIVLFGSYAHGKPRRDSDVDLLIIMKSRKRPVDRAVEVTKVLHFYPFPMDILVRTPKELRRRLQMEDPFYEDILKRGKVLYEL